MYEFWYGYIKSKYNKEAKSCNMGADIFIVYVKTEEFMKILQKMLKKDMILQILS